MQKSLKQNIKCPIFAPFKSVQISSSNTESMQLITTVFFSVEYVQKNMEVYVTKHQVS